MKKSSIFQTSFVLIDTEKCINSLRKMDRKSKEPKNAIAQWNKKGFKSVSLCHLFIISNNANNILIKPYLNVENGVFGRENWANRMVRLIQRCENLTVLSGQIYMWKCFR